MAAEGEGGNGGAARGRTLIKVDRAGMIYAAESGPVEALRDISLAIHEGEFVALVGPSGCGKSTLMRAMAGLRPVTSGRILVDGAVVDRPIPKVGMVFQAALLLKWRSVLDNVLLPAELSGLDRRKYVERARMLLKLVGLADFANKRPGELSGGMQQRASLCRALILDPPILLMDEPFGALDAMTRDDMNIELLRIWGEDQSAHGGKRKTIVFVTHSIPEAVFLADRVVVMSPRPGRVANVHSVPIARPRTAQTRASGEAGRLSFDIYTELSGTAGGGDARTGVHW
jgi:NitT/TauT family transport system ATP-binding protein